MFDQMMMSSAYETATNFVTTTIASFGGLTGTGPEDVWAAQVAADSANGVIVIGAPYESTDDGAFYIRSFSGSQYVATQNFFGSPSTSPTENTDGGRLGFSVAMSDSGDTIAVGVPGNSSSAGAVFIYTKSGNTWSKTQTLQGDITNNDQFGTSVAISADGRTLVVGAPGATTSSQVGAGAAFTFYKATTSFAQQARLVPTSAVAGNNFGHAVSIAKTDGNTVAVGERGSTAVKISTRSGTTWSTLQTVNGSVALSIPVLSYDGTRMLLITPKATVSALSNSGEVKIYTRSGTFSLQTTLTPSDPAANSYFGGGYSNYHPAAAITPDNTTIYIGRYCGDAGTTVPGDMYTFTFSGSWSQTAKVTSSTNKDHMYSTIIPAITPYDDGSRSLLVSGYGDSASDISGRIDVSIKPKV